MTIDPLARRTVLQAAVGTPGALRRTAGRVRWATAAHCVTAAAGVLLVGLTDRPLGVVVGAGLLVAAWSVVGAIATASSGLPARFRLRYATTIALWTMVLVAVLVTGALAFPGSVAFWSVGAAVCAAPGLWFACTSRAT